MSAKTKILVMKKREVCYTILLLLLALVLILLLISMFSGKTDTSSPSEAETENLTQSDSTSRYLPGIYTSCVSLGTSSAEVEVTVDQDHINSIRLINHKEAATAMYPLVSPSMEEIAGQICAKQSLQNITCSSSNKYTAQLLLQAIARALETASVSSWQ